MHRALHICTEYRLIVCVLAKKFEILQRNCNNIALCDNFQTDKSIPCSWDTIVSENLNSFLLNFIFDRVWFGVVAFQHSCVPTSPYLSLPPQGGGRRGVCNDVATFPVFKQTTSQNKTIHILTQM